ncbi:hypothetical protein Glove_606g121 [Diversispora epigaea]|uniref:Galactose oxidase n=1 Tax=Diversispora epigaea TaxID=1348612 RepID=A0A397G9S1_9GLOM|nr:hypothetical protein Glove_606g121 [Diversispora epigaea]
MVSFGLVILCITFLINPILCYIPESRIGHSGLVIQNTLLLFGGWKYSSNLTKKYTDEIFYLNLTQQFDVANPSWELVLGGNLPLSISFSASFVSTFDDNLIYVIGGYMSNITTGEYDYSNLAYMYNYSLRKWTALTVMNITPRQEMMGIIDDKGIAYIFGGYNITNDTTYEGVYYNDMRIFNASSMELSPLSITQNLPSPFSSYTANLLKNGIIVYIGGLEDSHERYPNLPYKVLGLETLRLFDTIKAEWSSMNVTGGDNIDPRFWHSSVLNTKGEIILFGGCTTNFSRINTKFAILNTNKDIYEWTTPSISDSPPLLYGHNANLHGNYMIITFGVNLDNLEMSTQIYLFDVNQYTWVTTYTPPPVPPKNDTSKKSSKVLIGIAVGVGGGIVLVILVSIGVGVLLSKRRNKRRKSRSKKHILEIPSSSSI